MGDALDAFLRLYAAGRFFDAHEELERVWRRSPDPRMTFLQGLIQLAVAFEHHRRGNPRGACALLDRAWTRIAPAPPGFLGLDVSQLRARHAGIAAAFAAWRDGAPRPDVEAPPLSLLAGPPPCDGEPGRDPGRAGPGYSGVGDEHRHRRY